MRKRIDILVASMQAEMLQTNTWENLNRVIDRLGPSAPGSLVKAEHFAGMLRSGFVTFDEAVAAVWCDG